MSNKEAGPHEVINDAETQDSDSNKVLEEADKFDRAAAEKAIEDRKKENSEAPETPEPEESVAEEPETPETPTETPEAAEEIDMSCFDELNAEGFSSLPEAERKAIIARCEAAYDAAVVAFSKLGEFRDPEVGRYNGVEYADGLEGAKRGVDYMVQCVLNVDYWQAEVDKIQAELDKLGGFHLFGRKKIEDQKRDLWVKMDRARRELDSSKEWPGYIGPQCMGGAERFYSDEIQTKYQRLIQMKRDIKKAKYGK